MSESVVTTMICLTKEGSIIGSSSPISVSRVRRRREGATFIP